MVTQTQSGPNASPSDEELLRRVAQGSREALGEFYDRHAALLFGAITRIVLERGDAEDALEQTFVDMWNRAGTLDVGMHAPLGWALSLARAQALRRRVGGPDVRTLPGVRGAPETAAANGAPDATRAVGGSGQAVRELWCRLPEGARSIVEGAVLNGLAPQEIAEMLGRPVGTVRAELRDAMKRLRAELRSEL